MIELWFDFSCPYAYLASRWARRLPVEVDWRPMLLGGVFRGIGAGDGPMATISPQKQAHNVHDMHRWAELFGAPFRMPTNHPMSTVRALRTLLALPRVTWPVAIDAIFAAYWQRAEDVTQAQVIGQALRAAGIAEDLLAAAGARADDPIIKDELRQRTDEAISLGIFGAPAWVWRGGRSGEQGSPTGEPLLIWGQDRMAWIEAVLAGWRLAGPPPGGPRPFAPRERAADGRTLDVYFDVASPFAYLGLSQLSGLTGMGVVPRMVPILLGALFRDIQQANVPLLTMPAAKQRYLGREMERWASWWGVPFTFPRKFPQRTVTAQRLCVLAAAEGAETCARLALTLARAMWAEQRDLEDEQTLRAIVATAGLPESWVARTQEPAIKAQLADHTAAARQAGVFGVPTYVVGCSPTGGEASDSHAGGPGGNAPRPIDGKHLFWGQDRLELVARALAGWTPP